MVYLAFSPDTLLSQVDGFSRIQACAEDIRTWMYQNKLKLSGDKTVLMLLGNKPQLNKLVYSSVIVGDSYIESVPSTTNLGAGFDGDMSVKCHVQKVCIICAISQGLNDA